MFRSVIAVVCAALALVPGALLTSSAESAAAVDDGYPRGTTLYPGSLARGADTPLLHMAEEVIVDGSTRVSVRGVPNVWLLGRIDRDYLIQSAAADFSRYTVQLVHRNGDRRVLQRFGDQTTVSVSADGRHLALATPDRPNTRIRVVETRSGELVRRRTFASYGAEVSDYGVRRMVVTGLRNRTFWWDPVTNQLSLIVARPASADISADRLVVRVPHPKVSYQECQRTVRLSRPSVVLWRSCRDTPLTFSPDGSRMVTLYIESDGIGPDVVQVRRQGGKVLRTYRAPLYFGFIEWETNRRLLLQPVGKRYVAAVRCDIAGGCRRASRLYRSPGTYDPPRAMRWSFPS